MSHPWARLALAPWADFFVAHPEIPVLAAEVPGISQDVLAGLTAPVDSALPIKGTIFAPFLLEGFLGLLETIEAGPCIVLETASCVK